MKRTTLLLVVSATVSAAELYRVAGVVVDSQTGRPVANASITLSDSEKPSDEKATASDADGRFAFDVAQGRFRLMGFVAGQPQQYGQMSPLLGGGSSVVTGPGQDTRHLVFRWFRRAAISGRVSDQDGEPVEDARVFLLRSEPETERVRVTPVNQVSTDDKGEYRLANVPGGKYYLVVTGQPWTNSAPGPTDESARPAGYPPMYYPNTPDRARAAPLMLQSGEEARADFTLTAAPAATVTVECDNCDAEGASKPRRRAGRRTLSVVAESLGGIEIGVAQRDVYRWPSVFEGLLPGRYLVRLFDTAPEVPIMAEKWFDVGAADMTVPLTLRPPSAVSGRVTFKGGAARPSGTLIVRLERVEDGSWMTSMVRQDGAFRVSPVRPGKHRISLYGAGCYPATIASGDTALPDGVVTVEDGAEARVKIEASNETGRVRGFAMRDDRPVDSVMVVLVPRDLAGGFSNQIYQTDSDGSFDWTTMRAGDYLLFGVDDPTIACADADTVKPYLAKATSIHIEPGKVLDERVPVQPTAK